MSTSYPYVTIKKGNTLKRLGKKSEIGFDSSKNNRDGRKLPCNLDQILLMGHMVHSNEEDGLVIVLGNSYGDMCVFEYGNFWESVCSGHVEVEVSHKEIRLGED